MGSSSSWEDTASAWQKRGFKSRWFHQFSEGSSYSGSTLGPQPGNRGSSPRGSTIYSRDGPRRPTGLITLSAQVRFLPLLPFPRARSSVESSVGLTNRRSPVQTWPCPPLRSVRLARSGPRVFSPSTGVRIPYGVPLAPKLNWTSIGILPRGLRVQVPLGSPWNLVSA